MDIKAIYAMKDLGYPRTPTHAKYRTEMPDGSLWEVPLQMIADSRDEHYADEKEDTVGFLKEGSLDKFDIQDWAANNMNWGEVAEYAVKCGVPTVRVDFEEGWTNGIHKIVGKL